MPDDILDVAVVGAGFSGLGVSRELQRLGLTHAVLERDRIGETWRRQRWDSFHTNIPNDQMVMPAEPYAGPDPEGFLTRDPRMKERKKPGRPGARARFQFSKR